MERESSVAEGLQRCGVFIAGGTGAIGRQLVPKLVALGHEVIAMTRSRAKLAEIRASGADAVMMDGLDPGSVTAAVTAARPEVTVRQMTALATVSDLRHFDREFALTNQPCTEETRYLLNAVEKPGTRRFGAQSFTGLTNERTGSTLKDETSPLDPHPPKTMCLGLAALAELEETVTAAHAVEGVALRYGNFYRPGSASLLHAARQRKLPVVGSGAGLWCFVHFADAAGTAIAAAPRGPAGYAHPDRLTTDDIDATCYCPQTGK